MKKNNISLAVLGFIITFGFSVSHALDTDVITPESSDKKLDAVVSPSELYQAVVEAINHDSALKKQIQGLVDLKPMSRVKNVDIDAVVDGEIKLAETQFKMDLIKELRKSRIKDDKKDEKKDDAKKASLFSAYSDEVSKLFQNKIKNTALDIAAITTFYVAVLWVAYFITKGIPLPFGYKLSDPLDYVVRGFLHNVFGENKVENKGLDLSSIACFPDEGKSSLIGGNVYSCPTSPWRYNLYKILFKN
jgi:hypothetical protein